MLFVHLQLLADDKMPPGRKRKASISADGNESASSNVLVIKRERLMVKSQVSSRVTQ